MDSREVALVVFEQGWNRQEFAAVRHVLADEFPFHIGGDTRVTNADEFEAIVRGWHAAFADFRFEIHSIIADEFGVAVRATLRGTNDGPWRGQPPTGRSIAVEHAFFLGIDDGKVVEVWEILDRSALEAQLTRDD